MNTADLPQTLFFNEHTRLATRYLPKPLGYSDDDQWSATQLNVIGAISNSYLLQKTVESQITLKKQITSSDDQNPSHPVSSLSTSAENVHSSHPVTQELAVTLKASDNYKTLDKKNYERDLLME